MKFKNKNQNKFRRKLRQISQKLTKIKTKFGQKSTKIKIKFGQKLTKN